LHKAFFLRILLITSYETRWWVDFLVSREQKKISFGDPDRVIFIRIFTVMW